MADVNGVFFSMVAPTNGTSKLDILRAKVRSSQQKVVASSKNILQSQQREQLSRSSESPTITASTTTVEFGECSMIETTTSNTRPLHMQQDDSVTHLLQEQLRLLYADRASLEAEISALQRTHRERESSLQSEVMSFRYKYDVLKKEMELNEHRQAEELNNVEQWDERDDTSPQYRRLDSSPPNRDYFQFTFGRNGNFSGRAMRDRRERDDIDSCDGPDSENVQKLRDEVESFKAKEKKYTNEILYLQMEIQRIKLEQERIESLEPGVEKHKTWLNGTMSKAPTVIKQQTGGFEVIDVSENFKSTGENFEVTSQIDESTKDAETSKALEQTRKDLIELQEVFTKLEEKNKHMKNMTRKLKDESHVREEKFLALQRRNQELEEINKEREKDYRDAEERNKELERQCKKFKAENQEFERIYDDIYKRSNDLLLQNDKLESRTKALEAKNLELNSELVKLEGEKLVETRICNTLKKKLVTLSSLIDKHEKTVRITNGTTGRSSEVVVTMSHTLSLYDSIYCSPTIRASRVRTWPAEIAENVRRKNYKVICTMLDDDGETITVLDIEELKQLSTSVLFQSSDYAHQDKILMVLGWIALKTCQLANTYQPQPERSALRVHIENGYSKRSRELNIPLSESLTVLETVYNHEGVRAAIRRWPRDIVWRVTNRRSRILCRASTGESEFAKYSLDELKSLTLRDLQHQAGIEKADRRIFLVFEEDRITKKEELYLPFSARGFRNHGWTLMDTQSKMRVRLKNETTQRSRDMLVLISSDLSLFDAVYNSEEARQANIRKWKPKFVREVKTDLSRLQCVFLGDEEAVIRTCSVDSLKTITTSDAKNNLSNTDGSVSILLRCAKTKKGVDAARHEEMRLRIVNQTTRRAMFLYVHYSKELTLYDSVYNNPEVRAAQVRMWPKEVLHAIKGNTATIQCHLFDCQASENELQVFSIQKLKETPTKRLFDLIPNSKDVPQLVLKYHSVGYEKTEISLVVSNDATGRFKELEVPVSQDMTLYDVIYQSASIKFSYVRMWPSDVVQKVKNKTAEICCVMKGKEHAITFSIEDMKKTTTTQLIELSPPPYDLIRLVLKYKEINKIEDEPDSREIKEIQIRIKNQQTGRFRDLTVPLSADLSLYRSIYNNRSVKAGKVRVWPGKLVQDLKQKVVEVECAVLAANNQIIYTYTVEGMRNASTKELFDLVQRSEQRINLLLRCETKAYTGNIASRLAQRYKARGFRQRGWLPKSSSPLSLRVRVRNEMTNRSVDLLVSALDFLSTVNDVIYQNAEVLRRGIRRWPSSAAQDIKKGSSEVLCVYLDASGSPIRKMTTEELCQTSIKQLLGNSDFSGPIYLNLRCVATSVVIIDVDGDGGDGKYTHNETLPTKTENTPAKEETLTEILMVNADSEIEEIESSKEQMPIVDAISKTGTFPIKTHDGVSDTGTRSPDDGETLQTDDSPCSLEEGGDEDEPKTQDHFETTRDCVESEIKNLGLYPEVFTSLGFEAIQRKDNRLRGIYPEVFGSLGVEVVKKKDEKKSLGMYPGVLVSLGFEVVTRKMENSMLCMYPEVLESLGFQVIKSYELEMIRGKGKKYEKVSTTNTEIIHENNHVGKTEVLETESIISAHKGKDLTKGPLLFQPSGFRQRGWLPVKPGASQFRVRISNEKTGRSRDLVVPVSDSLALFDAVYNEESVQHANIRHFPSQVALAVKQKACEILVDVFIPRYYIPNDQKTSFFGDSSDILIDEEGTAIRSFTLDDFRQTTTVEIFELMAQPRDMIKMVLRVQKVEAVNLLESKLSALEKQLRIASEQAKGGSELLAEKLKALEEATQWNQQLSEELEELRAGMNVNRPPSPRSEMIIKAKKQSELLEQKETALEQASERNESLKIQVAQLQKEIEILEVAANSSIMPDYKSVVDHVIEEEDDRDELSKDVSFRPIGFRQRGWRSDESASMDMRLRVTNESTRRSKDFVLSIDGDLSVFDAVYTEGSKEDILDKTSNIQCIVWHDMGKDVRTFSVNALKQMSTKRFFELTSRRQDLLKALIRCQQTAGSQVEELESEVHFIRRRNEELQNSMCVLSNELAVSVAKYKKLQRELDKIKQSQEGGLLFATELFEI